MNGIRRGSRAAMLWTGILLVALLAIVMVATSHQNPVLAQAGVEVSKEASVVSISPADLPFTFSYTVTFSNSNESEVVLDVVTDTLPAGFSFITVENPLSWTWSVVETGQTLVWDGPIAIPGASMLSLVYSVEVSDTVPAALAPYVNNVEAEMGETDLDPAFAPVYVRAPDLALAKSVSHTRVEPGGVVTFTVTLENSGFMTSTVTSITDTLDTGLTLGGVVTGTDPAEEGGTLVWAGPMEVPPLSTETLVYTVSVSADVAWLDLCNQVEVMADGQLLGPESTCFFVRPDKLYTYLPTVAKNFEWARLEIARDVEPSPAVADGVVLYTATITNVGDSTGELKKISDTLPTGFTFVDMAGTSDIQADPAVVAGALVWTGTWTMTPGHVLDVAYQIRVTGAPGDYTSSMELEALDALVPREPATVTMAIEQAITGLDATNDGPTHEGSATTLTASVTSGTNVVYTWDFGDGTTGTGQQVAHTYPAIGTYTAKVTAQNGVSTATDTTEVTITPAILLEDHFESGWDAWTEFLNYPYRLAPGQWYWDSNDGYNGSGGMTQDALAVDGKHAEDALLMYLQPGAEQWKDYRLEAKLIIRCDSHPQGLWVRGQYEDVGTEDVAGWVTGYYIMLGGSPGASTHFISLKQMQTTDDCWDAACNNPENLYDFNNPHELTITKKDGTLERWRWYTLAVEVRGANIKVWLDGELYIDYTDSKYPFLEGTVGLKTFEGETVSFDDVLVTPLD